jgi:hypothetical protein
MANRNILANPSIAALDGSEFLYLVKGGKDYKVTIEQVQAYSSGFYSANVNTTLSTITLDLQGYKDVLLTGSADIGVGKTIAFSNASNGKRLTFLFTLTGNYAFVFPNTVKMQNWVGDWDSDTYTWTPVSGAGAYRAEFFYNGINWLMNIYGAY